ncbi:hypothetical protein R7O13_31200, partial [Vibrio sp. Y176]|nr:hypothetical protein [Vibrio sp. Y176]
TRQHICTFKLHRLEHLITDNNLHEICVFVHTPDSTVVQWLALSPHSKQVTGLDPGWGSPSVWNFHRPVSTTGTSG